MTHTSHCAQQQRTTIISGGTYNTLAPRLWERGFGFFGPEARKWFWFNVNPKKSEYRAYQHHCAWLSCFYYLAFKRSILFGLFGCAVDIFYHEIRQSREFTCTSKFYSCHQSLSQVWMQLFCSL
jgi:hypothetical protein